MTRVDRYLSDPIRRVGYTRLSARRQSSVRATLTREGTRAADRELDSYIRKINPPRLTAKIDAFRAATVPGATRTPSVAEVKRHAGRFLPRGAARPERMTGPQRRAAITMNYTGWIEGMAEFSRAHPGAKINPYWYH
jgi:hypothetical protein